ncbi:hypothetical protein LTR56_008228 [Elasticomyces elasticus]|nr:hypothetical protein LTR56_008228 [Elasticomyces elasticus]KAK3661791.1 hypothetical protein LTR22_007374 [Elasticomyces elasticus]KAK4924396.1 hypothetical protein LTR49_008487 [Elasticomyces elasticus]KAK5762640.1 hypothetical protein LTS12_007230 [Elasticomyces elasticus]
MSAPQKPMLNGNHNGDGTKVDVGGTGSGSNAHSGGGGAAIQDTGNWFCCNANCQQQMILNSGASCRVCQHVKCGGCVVARAYQ